MTNYVIKFRAAWHFTVVNCRGAFKNGVSSKDNDD